MPSSPLAPRRNDASSETPTDQPHAQRSPSKVRLASLERKLEEAERRERQHAMDQKKAKEEEEKLKRENDRLRQLEAQDMIDQVHVLRMQAEIEAAQLKAKQAEAQAAALEAALAEEEAARAAEQQRHIIQQEQTLDMLRSKLEAAGYSIDSQPDSPEGSRVGSRSVSRAVSRSASRTGSPGPGAVVEVHVLRNDTTSPHTMHTVADGSATRRSSKRASTVEFKVGVSLGGVDWTVTRRLPHFQTLHADICRRMEDSNITVPNLPPLPHGHVDDTAVEKLRSDLETYVVAVVMMTRSHVASPFYHTTPAKLQYELPFFDPAVSVTSSSDMQSDGVDGWLSDPTTLVGILGGVAVVGAVMALSLGRRGRF
eukprot:m.54633 g.54633  ORF g.54633 m.54633 type:complete len:369 (+) comp7543_c0_seq2:37-1143(+)